MVSEREIYWAKNGPWFFIVLAFVFPITIIIVLYISTLVAPRLVRSLIDSLSQEQLSTIPKLLSAMGLCVFSVLMLNAYRIMLLHPKAAVEHEIEPPMASFYVRDRGPPETASEAKKKGIFWLFVFGLHLLAGIIATMVLTARFLS